MLVYFISCYWNIIHILPKRASLGRSDCARTLSYASTQFLKNRPLNYTQRQHWRCGKLVCCYKLEENCCVQNTACVHMSTYVGYFLCCKFCCRLAPGLERLLWIKLFYKIVRPLVGTVVKCRFGPNKLYRIGPKRACAQNSAGLSEGPKL
jgi:hypothetical protein